MSAFFLVFDMFICCLIPSSSNKSCRKPSLPYSTLLLLHEFWWQKSKKVISSLSLFYCFCYFLHDTLCIYLSCFSFLFSLWTSIYVLCSVSLMLSSWCSLSPSQTLHSRFNFVFSQVLKHILLFKSLLWPHGGQVPSFSIILSMSWLPCLVTGSLTTLTANTLTSPPGLTYRTNLTLSTLEKVTSSPLWYGEGKG